MNKIIEFIKRYLGELLLIIGTGMFTDSLLQIPSVSDTGSGSFGAMMIVLGIIIMKNKK